MRKVEDGHGAVRMKHLKHRLFIFVLNSLLDWEPFEKLKQRSGVASFTFVCCLFCFSG